MYITFRIGEAIVHKYAVRNLLYFVKWGGHSKQIKRWLKILLEVFKVGI